MNNTDFQNAVHFVVSQVQIEGGYRKPSWKELILVKLIVLPWKILKWSFQLLFNKKTKPSEDQPLTIEDMERMAIERIGKPYWEELNERQREEAIEMRVWEDGQYDEWVRNEMKKRPALYKRYIRYMKKTRNN